MKERICTFAWTVICSIGFASGAQSNGLASSKTPEQGRPSMGIIREIPDQALKELIQECLDRNPKISVFRAEAEAMAQRPRSAGALPDPMASLTLFLLEPQTRVGPQTASLSLSQKFPWFGKLELRQRSETLSAAADRVRVESLRLELVTRVRELYLELQYLQRERRIVRDEGNTLKHYEELAQARYASGFGTNQAVIKIQAEITRIRSRLLDIAQQRESLIMEINALRDRPDGTAVKVGDVGPGIGSLASLALIRDRAANVRPEIVEAQIRIEAAGVRTQLAEKGRRPDITLGINYGLIGGRDDRAGRHNPPEGNGDDVLGLSGGVNLPIWRSKIAAEVEEAVQRRIAAEHALRAVSAEVNRQVFDAGRRIPLIREQLELFDRVLTAQAEESLRSAETAYAAGTVDALDLLDAERVLLGVRIAAERTRTDLAIAAAVLEGAAGTPLSAFYGEGSTS